MKITSIISSGTVEGLIASRTNPIVVCSLDIKDVDMKLIRKIDIGSVIGATRTLVSVKTIKIIGNLCYVVMNTLPVGTYFLYAVLFFSKTSIKSNAVYHTVLKDNFSPPEIRYSTVMKTVSRISKNKANNVKYTVMDIVLAADNATDVQITLDNTSVTHFFSGYTGRSPAPLAYRSFSFSPAPAYLDRSGTCTTTCNITAYGPYGETNITFPISLPVTFLGKKVK